MASYGGDVKQVSFNNSVVGSGIFKPKAGEANTFDPGGIRVSDDAAAVTTDGEMIITKNRKLGFFQILVANDANVRKDLEKASQLAGSGVETKWTVSLFNGAVYRGVGEVVGDLTGDLDKATLPLKIASAEFKKI